MTPMERRFGRSRRLQHASAACLLVFLAACNAGPDYVRPDADLPKEYGVVQAAVPAPQEWWKVFGDPVLDRLVDEALAGNRDLRIAATRVEQSRAQVSIARADEWPDVGVRYDGSRTRPSERGAIPLPPAAIEASSHRLALVASWELDFWGRYRRATEAARAELAASEAGREAVRASLIGDVARGYFALRALDRRLDSVVRTTEGRAKALELQQLRYDAGVVSELDYRQVESDLRASQALVPSIRQQRLVREGALAMLLGRSPRQVFAAQVSRGDPSIPEPEVPAGLPSDLLLRRPDLREAEERLRAANARIGVARAAFFPSITLTGGFGGESQALGDIFSGAARTWSIAGGVLQPLLESQRIRGGVDLADARTREATERYRQAIANAFREVRDALAAQGNARDAHAAQRARERALVRTVELARLRYDSGAANLFEVLEAERQRLAASLEAIDAEHDRRNAIVDLYLALGS